MAIASILRDDLGTPGAERPFGTGWISGALALLLGLAGSLLVVSLRHPALLTTPDLAKLRDPALLLPAPRVMHVVGYVLALVSLVLRDNKVLGLAAVTATLGATLIGRPGKGMPAAGTGLFFGPDFFVPNVLFLRSGDDLTVGACQAG